MNEKISSHLIEANVHLQDENKVVKADNEILKRRIERAIEYIEETQVHDYEFNEYVVQVKELLEILKGEE